RQRRGPPAMVPPPSPRSWAPAVSGGSTETTVLTRRDGRGVTSGIYEQPIASKPISVLLAIIGCCVLSCCLSIWMRLPYIQWMVLMIYVVSLLFVLGNSILQFGLGSELNYSTCMAAEFLCLSTYALTKVFIYLFLVDRVHIVQESRKSRFKSRQYLINSFGMMGIYVVIIITNFIFRVNFYDNGTCVIGQSRFVLIPLIAFDAFINIYLTILFLIPLLRLYSVHLKIKRPYTLVLHSAKMAYTAPNLRLRRLAFRTFVGTCCTLASSVTNMTVLMILNGESSWLCFIACNSDVLFSALVIQWVTASDQAGSKNRECPPKMQPATSAATAVSSGTTGRQSGGKCEELQAASSLLLNETPGFRPRLNRRYSMP
ncbi:hypothetical protein PpBr36_08318, partial [Pyricularia pennisetigena]|uniref:hypothetical protein n=1 Tax=Pyricularia pennisetigena TaxID=1578925 RepID=UPI0011504975